MENLSVDITIIQVPTHVEFECPHCGEENELRYWDFCRLAGDDPHGWEHMNTRCSYCGHESKINNVDWD